MVQPKSVDRAVIEQVIRRNMAALEARDGSALAAGLSPEVYFVWLDHRWQDQDQVQVVFEAHLASWEAVRFYPRHILIDAAHQTAAIEWVCRYLVSSDGVCRELLGGTVLEFTGDGSLRYSRTYLDPVRSRTIPTLDIPWPDPGWSPCQEPGPPPGRAFMEQFIQANARAWSSHDLKQLDQIMHDDICVCPPWDYLVGRKAAQRGAQIYFDNYRQTEVTPNRLIIDPTQPYFGVCEQTFACTNPETGRRGADSDFAFFEIAQGKLRYWRTYFDTTRSVQTLEKTAGFIREVGRLEG